MIAGLQIRDEFYPITTELPVSLNYLLADVREPDKRNASYSKTIELNATNAINRLFENIFEVNSVTNTFNPNKKEPVIYYSNGEDVFHGSLQLKQISIKPDNNIIYSCSIIGEGGGLFVDIGDKFIYGNNNTDENLDFSEYDHNYTRTKQINSWSKLCDLNGTPTTVDEGKGYYYPFVHRGLNGGSDSIFNVSEFFPNFYLKEYIDKILTKAGYTYDSSIFNSDFFKKLIVYPNIDKIELTQSDLDNRQFYVGLNSDSTISFATNITSIDGTTYVGTTPLLTYYTPNLPNESTPFFDVGTQYSGNTAVFNESGNYNIAARDVVEITLTHSDTDVAVIGMGVTVNPEIQKSSDNGATYFVLVQSPQDWTPNTLVSATRYGMFDNGISQTASFGVATGEQFFGAGDRFKHRTRVYGGALILYDSLGNNITSTASGTLTFSVKLKSGAIGTSFYAIATQKQIVEGNLIPVNNSLPKKIKQKDLFKSTIQAFNLYIDVDKQNPKHLYIEDFSNFYNQGIEDWENKTDLNKEQIINPTLLEGKKYIFRYKSDTDLYNEKYKNKWGENYGTYERIIDNDFFKNEKVNEIIFSPTPNVANYDLGIAMPKIFKNENAVIKPHVPNIRLLFASGIKVSESSYTYKQSGQTDLTTFNYGYAGHVDDAFNPTIDLNFGLPKQVFYTYPNAYFTTNNLVNAYHLKSLNNATNKDAKLVTKYLYLNARNINKFTFRKHYFIDGAYYLVNKILDFDPNEENTIKVELIKLLDIDVFTPESFLIASYPGLDAGTDVGISTPSDSLRLGASSINQGRNCVAIGENILIPNTCTNVTVIGNNIVVSENVSNVSVINSENINITESGVNYINNKIVSVFAEGAVIKRDSDYTLTIEDETILVDDSLGNVRITLPPCNECYVNDISKEYNIKKRTGGVYKTTITPVSAEIDGETQIELINEGEAITIITDGLNWFIK